MSTATTTLLVSTFTPFNSLTISAPRNALVSDISNLLLPHLSPLNEDDISGLSLSLPSGTLPSLSTPLSELCYDGSNLVSLRLIPRLRGGKGGFGSQLRAAGGRMSSQKTNNKDSCRDLTGRRLSTLKEAKTLTQYLESEPQRKKAAQEAQKAKLEALEKKLGLNGDGNGDPAIGSKRRFNDTEYLEQSRDLVDNVKSAVSVGLLKKKKKVKTTPPPEGESGSSLAPSSDRAGSSSKVQAKVEKTIPPVVSAAIPAVDAVGA